MGLHIKQKLLKNLVNTYCRLGISKRHGVGVFAIRHIPKNTNPFLGCRKTRWFKFKNSEISILPKDVIRMIKEFYVSDNGFYYIPYHGLNGNDISFYLNHSSKPNVWSKNLDEDFLTLRSIKKGEELFLDYRLYDPDDPAGLI